MFILTCFIIAIVGFLTGYLLGTNVGYDRSLSFMDATLAAAERAGHTVEYTRPFRGEFVEVEFVKVDEDQADEDK